MGAALKQSWLERIIEAFRRLGGSALLPNLYAELGKVQGKPLTPMQQATVRKEIERHSSRSKTWGGRIDAFEPVVGVYGGWWRLRDPS
jgi:hypothetical protein